MRTKFIQAVLLPNQRYVCLSCRLQSVGVEKGRRYQHAASLERGEADTNPTRSSETPKKENNGESGSSKSSTKSETSHDYTQERQKILQQKFAAERRKQMLKLHANNASKETLRSEAAPDPTSVLDEAQTQPKKARPPAKMTNRQARRKQATLDKAAAFVRSKTARDAGDVRVEKDQKPISRPSLSNPLEDGDAIESIQESKSDDGSNGADVPKRPVAPTHSVPKDDTVSASDIGAAASQSKPAGPEGRAETGSNSTGMRKSPIQEPGKSVNQKLLSEKERKAELAGKLRPFIRTIEKRPLTRLIVYEKSESKSKPKKPSSQLSDVPEFSSLQGAIGRKSTKIQAVIERVDATKLEIQPLKVDQPPVPGLAYGLERVLFNPGVYQLQDPRSRVYNFDPYLQKIMPVAEFDFNALKEYITSSKDDSLKRIAKEHQKRYVGSTSSMTGALAHFHFLLSQWRPVTTSMMSKGFPAQLTSFSELQRTPSAIFLRWKDGTYAIDADKQFDSGNILSMLGKSMEKLLTLNVDDYERYRKSSPGEVSEKEQLAPESYHYSTMGDFLMRSQLDAHDPRLPGTGMFDLKTRAVVSIRMDVANYEHGLGYQIKSRQGEWESFEREYYDMIRAAFLKYSMQVRMGRMDGIFVAFHNVERIFGFQYISLPEMDSTIHGQWDTSLGDQEFKLSLDLLNKILDRATKKFPETSLRIHFETRDAATPFMYIFAEPVTEEQVAEIQGQNEAKIREFERNILGLNREHESEAQDSQEDDGKWDNIQASVQEAMDKDELSVDDPDQNQREAGDDDLTTNGDRVFGEELSYDHNSEIAPDEDLIAAIAGDSAEKVGEQNGENSKVLDEGYKKGQEVKEPDEESGDAKDLESEGSSGHGDDELEIHEAVPEGDSAIMGESSDSDLGQSENALDGRELSEGEAAKEVTSVPPDSKSVKKADKAAYLPPLPSEESSESEYQTEADRPFLDSVDRETAQADTSLSSSEILAMTLTIRNKVNNQFIHRPENISPQDVWSIEYSLVEVPTQQKAKALYQACQLRRKKKLDAPMVPEDAEVINHYLANLRDLSKSGKKWRQKMDESDSRKPVQVLGREINMGEGSLSDQESEA